MVYSSGLQSDLNALSCRLGGGGRQYLEGTPGESRNARRGGASPFRAKNVVQRANRQERPRLVNLNSAAAISEWG